jgi:IS605 OrfB family transposase
MEAFNKACDVAAQEDKAGRFKLHQKVYRKLRREMGLSSQFAVRVIGKVADAMKTDPHPEFYFHGAIPYDQRNSWLRPDGVVSLSTIEGRRKFMVRIGEFQSVRLRSGAVRAGMKLCYRHDTKKFSLAVVVEVQEPTAPASGILGEDFGIKNVATDSNGKNYTDDRIEKVRTRYNELRARLQSCGTKSAKRHLMKMSGRERRFKRDVNHRISKMIVKTAEGTSSMIAIEDLTHIRKRTTVRRSQKDRHTKWAFSQLRKFLEYKAALAGIPVILVNPKNTSRTCPKCLETAKKNRPTRDLFRCIRCGYLAPADYVGAQNIRSGAAFNLPIVAPMLVAAISQPSGGKS